MGSPWPLVGAGRISVGLGPWKGLLDGSRTITGLFWTLSDFVQNRTLTRVKSRKRGISPIYSNRLRSDF